MKLPIPILALVLFARPMLATKKEPAKAPLPAAISMAKSAFVANGGGSGTSLAFDEFYADMKAWHRFDLAQSPSGADIIIELKYEIVDKGERTGSAYNSYTKQTSVYSYDVTDPQLVVNIYDAKTNALLWSTTDHRRLARFAKNRDKETIKSADRLVNDLKDRIGAEAGQTLSRTAAS